MGGVEFTTAVWTQNDVYKAYREAVEEAMYEHGRDGYNGTISTTDFVRAVDVPRPMTVREAEKFANKRLDDFSKGDCEAIPVVKSSKLKPREVTVKVKVTAANIEQANGSLGVALRKAATEKVKLRENESVDEVAIAYENYREKLTVKNKVSVSTTEGKAETRYFIQRAGNGDTDQDWDKGYKSMAEARKALVEMMNKKSGSVGQTVTYEVVGRVRRDSGSGVINATITVASAEAEYIVKLVTISPNIKRDGWYFYGIASS